MAHRGVNGIGGNVTYSVPMCLAALGLGAPLEKEEARTGASIHRLGIFEGH